jgi:hypothetical protein
MDLNKSAWWIVGWCVLDVDFSISIVKYEIIKMVT